MRPLLVQVNNYPVRKADSPGSQPTQFRLGSVSSRVGTQKRGETELGFGGQDHLRFDVVQLSTNPRTHPHDPNLIISAQGVDWTRKTIPPGPRRRWQGHVMPGAALRGKRNEEGPRPPTRTVAAVTLICRRSEVIILT